MKKEQQKIIKHKENLESTTKYLPISEIKQDTIILKDWWLRAIIKVKWINLDLRSYEEQQIVVEQYRRFLNSIDFPFEILVRSTYLDMTDYISYMKKTVSDIDNEVLRWQWEKYVEFLSKLNETQWLLYTKEFYIVVPYYSFDEKKQVRKSFIDKFLQALSRVESAEKIVSNLRAFHQNKKKLDARCQLIIERLREINIPATRLKTSQIISLLFEVYNPLSHKKQSETVAS